MTSLDIPQYMQQERLLSAMIFRTKIVVHTYTSKLSEQEQTCSRSAS